MDELINAMQGRDHEAKTDATGSFRFAAPVGRYVIRVQPAADNPWMFVHSAPFTAPITGLTIVAGETTRQGFEIEGTVAAANGGALPSEVTVGLCVPGSKNTVVGTASGGAFRVGPFGVGARYTFEVEAIGFAPGIVGPFDATLRCERVTVQLQRWATVRCRVLRGDGTAAPRATVRLERDRVGTEPVRAWRGETDADGRLTFYNVIPGAYRVLARPTEQSEDAPAVAAVVSPGDDNDVQVVFTR